MKREEIINALEELQQKVKLSNHPSQLEIDILKDGLKELYNKVIEWGNEPAAPSAPEAPEMHVVQPEETAPSPTPVPEPPVAEEQPTVVEPDITPSYEETVQPPVVEPEPPAPAPVPEMQEPAPEIEKEDLPQPPTQPEPLAPQPEKKEHTVAERLEEGQKDNTLAGKWNTNPISDLKSAIGINDKFSFLHTLFKGKVDNYNEAIEKLNTASGSDEAAQYFQFLSSEYNWDVKSPEYLKLKEFVGRRFS